MNLDFKQGKLLPHYFKKIAYTILGLAILNILLNVFGLIDMDGSLTKRISFNLILLGLLILILTRDKIEDELTLQIRVKAYAMAFISGVIMVIFIPWFNLISDGVFVVDKSISELLIFMFLLYFIFYQEAIRRR